MEYKLEKITPEIAAEYLKHNTNEKQRNINMAKVRSYALDMLNGNWEVNGEAIVFSKKGVLKNGQHRLKAIIESGTPTSIVVIRGVDDDVNIYDCGAGRTVSQWGKATGYKISTSMSAAARIITSGFNTSTSRGTITDFIAQHYDELKEAARIVSIGAKHATGDKGAVCLCVYIARKKRLYTDEMLEDFFKVFNTGVYDPGQTRNANPALVARRQFVEKLPSGSRSTQIKHFEIVSQALRDYKNGRDRKRDYPYDANELESIKEIQKLHGFSPALGTAQENKEAGV